MKTKRLILAGIIVIAAFTTCKKDRPTASIVDGNVQQVSNENREEVPQKMYSFSKEQIMQGILKFKENVKSQQLQNPASKLISADSASLDSSLWVLEATLNYDFDDLDQYANQSDYKYKSFEVSIGLGNGLMVNSDDLDDVYNKLTDSVNAFLGTGDKVKIIDVQAFITGNGDQVTLKASPISYSGNHHPCIPLNPGNTLVKVGDPNCSPFVNTGAVLLEQRLNACHFQIPYYCAKNFYTSVQLKNFYGINYPTDLYSYHYSTPQYIDCNNISYSSITTFASNSSALCSSNKPTSAHIPTHAQVMWWATTLPSCVCFKDAFWNLFTTYGIPFYTNC